MTRVRQLRRWRAGANEEKKHPIYDREEDDRIQLSYYIQKNRWFREEKETQELTVDGDD
jgi:hypothetical protein